MIMVEINHRMMMLIGQLGVIVAWYVLQVQVGCEVLGLMGWWII